MKKSSNKVGGDFALQIANNLKESNETCSLKKNVQGVREGFISTIIHLCKKSFSVSTAIVSSAYRSNGINVIEQILGGVF